MWLFVYSIAPDLSLVKNDAQDTEWRLGIALNRMLLAAVSES